VMIALGRGTLRTSRQFWRAVPILVLEQISRSWHFSNMTFVTSDVGSQGQSRRDLEAPALPLMTPERTSGPIDLRQFSLAAAAAAEGGGLRLWPRS
jgi:hypothetical protein